MYYTLSCTGRTIHAIIILSAQFSVGICSARSVLQLAVTSYICIIYIDFCIFKILNYKKWSDFKFLQSYINNNDCFCFFAKINVNICPWPLPNQCPKRVIIVLRNILIFLWAHSNPYISWPKTVFALYQQRFRIQVRRIMT